MKKPMYVISLAVMIIFYACQPNANQKAARQKVIADSTKKSISAKADSVKASQVQFAQLKSEIGNYNSKLEDAIDELNKIKQIQNGRNGGNLEQQIQNQNKNIQQLRDEIIVLQTKVASFQK